MSEIYIYIGFMIHTREVSQYQLFIDHVYWLGLLWCIQLKLFQILHFMLRSLSSDIWTDNIVEKFKYKFANVLCLTELSNVYFWIIIAVWITKDVYIFLILLYMNRFIGVIYVLHFLVGIYLSYITCMKVRYLNW